MDGLRWIRVRIMGPIATNNENKRTARHVQSALDVSAFRQSFITHTAAPRLRVYLVELWGLDTQTTGFTKVQQNNAKCLPIDHILQQKK